MPAPAGTRLTLSQIMSRNDTNLMGTVHGGVLMGLVDSAAGVVAARHCAGDAVTVAMDEMVFLVPVRVGDVLQVSAQVNWVGATSMEVGVRVSADRWNSTEPAVHVASAYLVLVAVDGSGAPCAVPPVRLETDDDHRRHREARIRRDHRLARRAEILRSRADDAG